MGDGRRRMAPGGAAVLGAGRPWLRRRFVGAARPARTRRVRTTTQNRRSHGDATPTRVSPAAPMGFLTHKTNGGLTAATEHQWACHPALRPLIFAVQVGG